MAIFTQDNSVCACGRVSYDGCDIYERYTNRICPRCGKGDLRVSHQKTDESTWGNSKNDYAYYICLNCGARLTDNDFKTGEKETEAASMSRIDVLGGFSTEELAKFMFCNKFIYGGCPPGRKCYTTQEMDDTGCVRCWKTWLEYKGGIEKP